MTQKKCSNVENGYFLGNADYIPIFLSQIPQLFYSGALPVDVALISVSPPGTLYLFMSRKSLSPETSSFFTEFRHFFNF